MGRLDGKVALVTGASRGIGRAIALRLAADGARVGVHYATARDAAAAVRAEIEAAGGEAFLLRADLSALTGIEGLVDDLRIALDGRLLDILVNNAGIGASGTIADTDEAGFDALFALDVKAPFFLTQQLLPLLADGGRIINISSVVSMAAYPTTIAYAAAKAALNSMTVSLAVGLGPRGISVNAVAPGATATDFLGPMLDDPAVVGMLEKASVFGRLGQPGDIAGLVAFLAGPEAGWVTGQLIAASGGMHL
ncbi:SDR family oxidoreductase [Sphingobium sp. WTD-1]|uniref:SDR family oxidoreductase n=1 Tax=Sphingobium sp. WTD-1 TaxID=2979467 RepID=UPI0024DE0868|nr:SDR family oxidoreductase [Sphingobium sp. WTD-1]WIA55289.1 SDR family oxidoreductase [Sphingobium sp. WTD-1]